MTTRMRRWTLRKARMQGVSGRRSVAAAAALLLLLLTVGIQGSCPTAERSGTVEEFGEVHWYVAESKSKKGTS